MQQKEPPYRNSHWSIATEFSGFKYEMFPVIDSLKLISSSLHSWKLSFLKLSIQQKSVEFVAFLKNKVAYVGVCVLMFFVFCFFCLIEVLEDFCWIDHKTTDSHIMATKNFHVVLQSRPGLSFVPISYSAHKKKSLRVISHLVRELALRMKFEKKTHNGILSFSKSQLSRLYLPKNHIHISI